MVTTIPNTLTLVFLPTRQLHCHARDPCKHKIHSQIYIWPWNSIFKWPRWLRITGEYTLTSTTHTRGLELAPQAFFLATTHCPPSILCFRLSAVYSLAFTTYVWASMRSWACTQFLDSIFCWEFLPHHIIIFTYQTHSFFKTQLIPHFHQEALSECLNGTMSPSHCFLSPLSCLLFSPSLST